MSEPQEIIARNFEQICKDVNIPADGEFGQLEKTKLYTAIRSFVYEWMCDISTLKDAGLSAEELDKMKAEYKPNKYESL
jgi:hypothetical protein|tara:strand:+ start:75 stop:311 length:237 start_codon:yes stop_codon:yes gene_type:complete